MLRQGQCLGVVKSLRRASTMRANIGDAIDCVMIWG